MRESAGRKNGRRHPNESLVRNDEIGPTPEIALRRVALAGPGGDHHGPQRRSI